MFGEMELGREFFEGLTAFDAEITARVAAGGCRFCGGPLHRGDYKRKPRGGALAGAGETFARRFSLCCGREGCRRRAMPPSVRFLGRRVYLGAVVIVAAVIAFMASSARAARQASGVPARTTRRWVRWWRGPFLTTAVFVELSARMVGVERHRVPGSILDRITGSATEKVQRLLAAVAPLTTASLPDGSRFVRAAM